MIELAIEAVAHDLGGFQVGRVLPNTARRSVGPFVFLDHFGPVRLDPGFPDNVDVRPHPHIGLSTVTYLLAGEITHRDSLGSRVDIRPGEVNWMTAGRGITHSERFESLRRSGGELHGVQAWVALPADMEETAPAFAQHGPEDLPTYEFPGLWARLIAGEAFGAASKVRTHSPMFYVHWRLGAGATAQVPAEYSERAALVCAGSVSIEGQSFGPGKLLVFTPGAPVPITGVEAAEVMLLGGEPLGPRYLEWNFVSSSPERIEQAKADWRAGRMKLPDHDHAEFIPLPPNPPAAAPPMS